eukprot:RCo055502
MSTKFLITRLFISKHYGSIECSLEEALDIYRLCHMYQMVSLLSRLEQGFISKLSQETVLVLYSAIELFSEALKGSVMGYLREHAAELFHSDRSGWLKLAQSEMLAILSDDHLPL